MHPGVRGEADGRAADDYGCSRYGPWVSDRVRSARARSAIVDADQCADGAIVSKGKIIRRKEERHEAQSPEFSQGRA